MRKPEKKKVTGWGDYCSQCKENLKHGYNQACDDWREWLSNKKKCSRCKERPSEGLGSSRDMCFECYIGYSDDIANEVCDE